VTGPQHDGPEPGEPVAAASSIREVYRQQLLASIGGWSGALISAVPTAVFVVVNVLASLRVAIGAAIASALLLAGYRMVRKQSVQQALAGLGGVVVAALIAARTGQARGYFLLGIWASFAYAVPFAVSLLVRRPLIGWLWEFLDPTPGIPEGTWHRHRILRSAYTWATLAATVVFLARGVVQLTLYNRSATGWLAFAKIAMGYPVTVALVGFCVVIVRRARHRLAGDHPHLPDPSG
jgi:Protein of unknown function (DUF3159)